MKIERKEGKESKELRGRTKGDFHKKSWCISFLVVISVYNKIKVLPITFLGGKTLSTGNERVRLR